MSLSEYKRAHVCAAIKRFHDDCSNARKILGAIDDLLGIEPESILNSVVYRLIDGYIAALGDAYAIHGWLNWWAWECQFGEKPLGAQVGENPEREITTIDDLVAIVLEVLELPEVENEEDGVCVS